MESRELLAADLGDAATSSGTAYVSASHEAVGPKLGVLRDANASAVANSLANGDRSDEDGVVFSALRVGESGTMTVHVNAAPVGAKLSAWIDFNRDGGWNNVDERIALNVAVAEGDNVVTFAVPATVASGHYYARVRLSTAGTANPGGAAADGEVEDYLVPIAHADSGVFGGEQPISFDDWPLITPIDLDGDGDVDLLTGRMSWFQNINGRYAAESQLRSATYANITAAAGALAPADVDGDGDMDIFATVSNSSIGWYENNGSQLFTLRTIDAANASGALVVVDLDGDGDLDLASGSLNGAVRWYVNDGHQSFTKAEIAGSPLAVRTLVVADADDDGDLDMIAAPTTGQTIRWLENDGQQNFVVREVAATSANPSMIDAADVDGDGDLDVLAAYSGSSGGVVWYENDGNQSFSARNMDAVAASANALTIVDLDGDGDLDVAAAGANRVAWYENEATTGWRVRTISAAAGAHFSVAAVDVDGDGRLDLVAAGTGSAPIAWYPQLADYDYGDAPSPYPVYNQQNGARHNAIGPRLGAMRDAEANASRAPAGAEAEDDGVVFGTLTLSESTGTATVNVQNAPRGAKLDAWIDFDGDGSWGLAGEQIAFSAPVVEGDNVLSFAIPSWAAAGATYARFRVSSAGGLGPNGTALDGEVEDHPVVIGDRAPASGFFNDPQAVGPPATFWGGDFIVTADVDGDGDMDVVGRTSTLAWAENLGAGQFVLRSTGVTNFGAEDFAAGDLDGDGDVDFVGFSGPQAAPYLVWAENDGQQQFTRRVVPYKIPVSSNLILSTSIVDLDGDGDMDVLASSSEGGVYLFVNDGRQQFVPQYIGDLGEQVATAVAADMDGDGDLDVVAGGVGNPYGLSSSVYDVAWFQNNGGLNFTWRGIQPRTISRTGGGATRSVVAGDIDGDGDFDVVSAGTTNPYLGTGYTTLWWHEQVGEQAFVSHAIDVDKSFDWATLADFDGDGDLDVVASGFTSSVEFYENVGTRFIRRQLSTAGNFAYSSAAADMDNDGDLDLVALGVPGSFNVSWFENVNLVDPDYGDAPAPWMTTRADGGAVHNGGGPRLGASRTSEADGVPSAGADADAGDDGVIFSAIRVGQASASVTVNVQNAPAGAKLDAWIDFNGDGSWGGAGEQIFGARAVVEGDNLLAFNVPAGTVVGGAVARFRLSTAGGLREGGAAIDGEVEDYLLLIAPPAAATGEYLVGAPIGSGPSYDYTSPAQSIFTADIDGDGDLDYVATNSGMGPNLAWYENLGDGAFLMHTKNFYVGTPALNARPVDLDGDGDVDFAVVVYNGVAWFENDGLQNFTYRAPASTSNAFSGVFDLADVDGDGDLDALAARSAVSNQSLVVLLNDGQQRFTPAVTLTTLTVGVSAIRAADVDGDGDMDFAATFEGSNSAGGVAWYENDGAWTFHDVTRNGPTEPSRAGRDVVPIDFDFDGDIDFVASTFANSFQLALDVFRNDGEQNFTRETLATFVSALAAASSPARGNRLQVADLDGDGDYDIVTAIPPGVRLYRYEEQGYVQTAIHQFGGGPLSVTIAVGDVDGDGRLEILASEGRYPTVRLDDVPFGDYNRDGAVDQADRDLYEATLGQPAVPPGSGADGDRSGTVDAADLAIWEANQSATAIPPVKAADLNRDERIDGADFLLWQRGFGAVTTIPGTHWADVDYTTTVDGGDLAVWMRQYGQGLPYAPAAPAAAVSVPAGTAVTIEATQIETPAAESQATGVELSDPLPIVAFVRFAIPKNVVLNQTAQSRRSAKEGEARRSARETSSLRDAALALLGEPPGPTRSLYAMPSFAAEIKRRKREPAAMTPTLIDELLGSAIDD